MKSSNIPILNILDVIYIKRENTKLKTYNKSCYVLSCRISGESVFFYNNTHVTVKAGDILFIPYGISYSQECENEEIICFHLEAYNSLPDEILVFPNEKKETADKVCALFKSASAKWRNKEYNYKYKCMAILYEILSVCDITVADSRKIPSIIKSAIKFLECHIFDLDLSIDKICKNNNLSRTHFNKLFKKTYGITPVKYINNQRIKKAKFLLRNGNYTNEEIAHLCGFGNIKYFYVVFKNITGQTTKEYRSFAK